jgi:hypothetical protein
LILVDQQLLLGRIGLAQLAQDLCQLYATLKLSRVEFDGLLQLLLGPCVVIKLFQRASQFEMDTIALVSAKFSLSHAAISAPQLLDCEALFGSE